MFSLSLPPPPNHNGAGAATIHYIYLFFHCRRNILILETITMQIAVFRPLVLFLSQVLKLDGTFPPGVVSNNG